MRIIPLKDVKDVIAAYKAGEITPVEADNCIWAVCRDQDEWQWAMEQLETNDEPL